jgi:hemolysin activation/secretion protein
LHKNLKLLLGNDIDNSTLQLARQRINSNCFYKHGYINSGIVYPDQSFSNHKLLVEVIEGHIEQLSIQGNSFIPEALYRDYLREGSTPPLQINALRESILLLEQHPLVDKIDAQLMPGKILGQGLLNVAITETKPYFFKTEVNNIQRNPGVGEVFVNLLATHYSITGHGDELILALSLAEGLNELLVNYRFPLSAVSQLTMGIASARSTVVEEPFDRLDIYHSVDRIEVGYNYLPIRAINERLQLHGIFRMERSHSSLLGRDFSFSPGVQEGRTRLSIIEMGVLWSNQISLDRYIDQAWIVDSRIQIGLPIFSATDNEHAPDGQFFLWRFQGQWRKRLSNNGQYQLLLRANAQWSDDTLLPMEVFSFGGVNSVRGYRQSQFPRDMGWSASVNLPIRIDANVEVTPFFDMGQAWNHVGLETKKLMSLGVAVDWHPSKDFLVNVFFALPLIEKNRQGNTLQDQGIGLRLQYYFR